MNQNILAGLDIGSEKVTCIVAEVDDQGILHITGAGQAQTGGSVRSGLIVDLQGAADAASIAMEEAESLSGWEISDTAVSISGTHVRGLHGRGTVNVEREGDLSSGEITWTDIEDALETAQLIKLPRESIVLRTVKCGYSIDGFERLSKPPVGLRADRLTADIYMVTADRSAIQNIEQVIHNTGRKITGIFPAASAGARAVLTRDEMEIGVAFADIGASTTDIAVFYSGTLAHLTVIPVGGEAITRDLQQLRIPHSEAERLKKDYSNVSGKEIHGERSITASTFGGRNSISISSEMISGIASRRISELMEEIMNEINRAGIQQTDIPAGIVLTGGTSHLMGITRAASRITGLPAEIGTSIGLNMASPLAETPEFAAAVGLVLLSREEKSEYGDRQWSNPLENAIIRIKGLFNRLR
ncbi:MAG: cell division protein FtsA [Candidatus Fermentibacteraceae bacterium]|nr:cell division protein FtsA [Candidatus Fermentibacteraceae bacterium]